MGLNSEGGAYGETNLPTSEQVYTMDVGELYYRLAIWGLVILFPPVETWGTKAVDHSDWPNRPCEFQR